MTPKQAAFAIEYLIDLNASQAAIRAGYSSRTAGEQGNQLLNTPEVADAIARGMAERAVIREREAQSAKLDVKLRTPRREPPNIERLREALEQRATEWRATLRSEPKVARLLIRRLIAPLELYEASEMPDFIKAD